MERLGLSLCALLCSFTATPQCSIHEWFAPAQSPPQLLPQSRDTLPTELKRGAATHIPCTYSQPSQPALKGLPPCMECFTGKGVHLSNISLPPLPMRGRHMHRQSVATPGRAQCSDTVSWLMASISGPVANSMSCSGASGGGKS